MPRATLDRAQKLLDQPFRQAVGPGELEIPAVRGLGGSLVYFIDPKSDLGRVWDIEFEPTGEGAAKADAGLTVVDHISQSMHYEEMLTWLLFYTSLLDLAKTPEQDVLDPGGLVKSQVVAVGRRRRCASSSTPRSRAHAVVALPVRRRSARACSTSPSRPTTSSRPSPVSRPTA